MAFNAGDIETTLELDRTPFNQGLDKAEKDARGFEKKKFRAKIDVEVDQRQVDRDINRSTSGKKPKIEIDVDIDQAKVAKKIDEIADNTEKTAERSGNRFARALLNPVMIQLGLLPGIAAVAAAGAGAAMLAPVAIFGLWGAAAAKNSAEVKEGWLDLKKTVVDGSKEMSGPMRMALVDIMNEAKGTFQATKPLLTGMFADAAPHLSSFASSLMGMTVNTLPGFSVALQRGDAFMRGWDGLLRRVGTGISDLVDNATRMESADTAMTEFGNTIQIVLGFVGDLVAMFGEAWAKVGGDFNQALGKAVELSRAFASSALPAMVGGLTMLLSILTGVMTALGPLANILGSGVGTILAAAAAYKILTAAMGGIGRAGTAVKTAVASSVSGMTNAGMAMGLVGTNATKMSKDVDDAGKSQGRFAKLASGTGAVLGKVGSAIPVVGVAFVLLGALIESASEKASRHAQIMEEQRVAVDNVANQVKIAAGKSAGALDDYNKAIYMFGQASGTATAAQERLAQATLKEKDAQKDAAEATKTHTERLLGFFEALAGGLNKQVAYNNTIKDVKEKQEALAESVKKTGEGSMATKFAQDELSLAMVNQVTAAGNLAIAQNANATENDKLTAAQKATALEAIKLIDIFGKQAPPALYQTIAAMSDAELQAIGGRREFDNMGNAIIHVPEHKPIHIDSNMHAAAQEALALKTRVDQIPTGTRYFTYIIDTVVKPGPDPSLNSLTGALRGRNAYGTSNWGGGLSMKDEHGPEFIQLPAGAKVFTNNRSRGMVHEEVRRALVEIGGGFGGGDTYNNTFNPPPMADQQWLDDVAARVSQRQKTRVYQGR